MAANPAYQATSCLHHVGIGNDVHRLVVGRKLVLGGVAVPFEKGPVGHSDGDALAHAICDALLGAAALGDIGQHFPDTSAKWRRASSLLLLRHVRKLLDRTGFTIVNIDSTIGLERPKLAPYIPGMQRKLAAALLIRPDQISVKAKSGEGLDAVGRGQALRADAIALLFCNRDAGSRRTVGQVNLTEPLAGKIRLRHRRLYRCDSKH